MKSKHIYLNLFLIDFPINAITSIIHRISGVILFFFIPFVLYFFKLSIESETSFNIACNLFSKYYIKIIFSFLYFMIIYHLINGLKHIVIDLGFFETINSSKNFSLICLFLIFLFYFMSFLI